MTPSPWFDGFEARAVQADGYTLHLRMGGNPQGPAVLMLHGFPQTHVMWHRVAQRLAHRFRLVMPDLPGYGDSRLPPSAAVTGAPHEASSKRAMARVLVRALEQIGLSQWHVVGHDRGGRVAHRLALDHPARIQSVTVIDIAPTLDMYEGRSLKGPYMDFARLYYHWFHLIQSHPVPESHIDADARAYLHLKLGRWGAQGLAHLEPEALREYERCISQPEVVHAMCEDYRASAGVDLEHDRTSRARGDRVGCPLQVLWGERGVVHRMFEPLPLWQAQCSGTVQGHLLAAGHYIPEELPQDTAQAIEQFIDEAPAA